MSMRRWITTASVLAFLATGFAAAQTKVESVTKEKSSAGTTKSKAKTVTGTVKEYEAGKKIKITGPGDKTSTFELDENARVEGSIAIGQMAKVEYTKDAKGMEHVTVLSEQMAGAPPAATKAKAAEARTAQSGGSMWRRRSPWCRSPTARIIIPSSSRAASSSGSRSRVRWFRIRR